MMIAQEQSKAKEIVAKSDFIFEGKMLEYRTYQDEKTMEIHTNKISNHSGI